MTKVDWKPVKKYSEIFFERAGKIAKITMNQPEKLNAFTPEMVQQMIDAFTICRDDSTIGVIILTGAGNKAFSSGGDQTGHRMPSASEHTQLLYFHVNICILMHAFSFEADGFPRLAACQGNSPEDACSLHKWDPFHIQGQVYARCFDAKLQHVPAWKQE